MFNFLSPKRFYEITWKCSAKNGVGYVITIHKVKDNDSFEGHLIFTYNSKNFYNSWKGEWDTTVDFDSPKEIVAIVQAKNHYHAIHKFCRVYGVRVLN